MQNQAVNFLKCGVLLVAALCGIGVADAAKSARFTFSAAANNQTITWTWSEDRETGQFCNGDWWVVGPITLTSITRPNGAADKDGTQFGPTGLATWGSQGFDSRIENLNYVPSLNIANRLPYSVPVNSSLISSVSQAALSGRNQLGYQAVLTVLPSAPPAGSFRPFYGGSNKAITHNKNDIDYSKFLNLAPVAGAPGFAGLEEAFRYVWVNLGNDYPGNEYAMARYNCPDDNARDPFYGAIIADYTTRAGMLLNLNYTPAQKEALAILYVQCGLDIYGAISNGAAFPGNGGHSQGRKLPFVIAAHVLNDPAMRAACVKSGGGTAQPTVNVCFGEDQQTFYVTQGDIDLPRKSGTIYQMDRYPQSSLGMPEWGPDGGAPAYTAGYPVNTAGYNWGRTYRFNDFPYLVGAALITKLMGLQATWNHPAFFDYTLNRFAVIEYGPMRGDTRSIIPAFTLAMLDAYGGNTPVQPTVVSNPTALPRAGSYSLPQSVSLSTVTSGASIYYTTDGSLPTVSSTLYQTPIGVSASTTIKAVAIKSGLANSSVMTSAYTITLPIVGTGVVSASTWPGPTAAVTIPQTNSVSISVKATPSSNPVNAQVGLAQGLPSGYGAIAVIGRFNESGRIDANNGNPYSSKNELVYSAGVTYTFEFTLNLSAKTFDLRVTPEGQQPVLIAENHAFRPTAPSDQLTNIVIHHDANSGGYIVVDDTRVGGLGTRPTKPVGFRIVN